MAKTTNEISIGGVVVSDAHLLKAPCALCTRKARIWVMFKARAASAHLLCHECALLLEGALRLHRKRRARRVTGAAALAS
jgi:hypothetical protein